MKLRETLMVEMTRVATILEGLANPDSDYPEILELTELLRAARDALVSGDIDAMRVALAALRNV